MILAMYLVLCFLKSVETGLCLFMPEDLYLMLWVTDGHQNFRVQVLLRTSTVQISLVMRLADLSLARNS